MPINLLGSWLIRQRQRGRRRRRRRGRRRRNICFW